MKVEEAAARPAEGPAAAGHGQQASSEATEQVSPETCVSCIVVCSNADACTYVTATMTTTGRRSFADGGPRCAGARLEHV